MHWGRLPSGSFSPYLFFLAITTFFLLIFFPDILSDLLPVPPACPGRFRVLDECDEMLNMGFVDDVEKILNAKGVDATQVTTMLFSATLPTWVKDITRRFLKPGHALVDLVGTDKMKASPPSTYIPVWDGEQGSFPPVPAGQGKQAAVWAATRCSSLQGCRHLTAARSLGAEPRCPPAAATPAEQHQQTYRR